MKKYYCPHCHTLHDRLIACHICGYEELKEITISIQHNEKQKD